MSRTPSQGSKLSHVRRVALSVVVVAFFLGHGLLSLRSAMLQDDRYGWRMFHNVGFSQVDYYWVTQEGKRRRFVPRKSQIVRRGRRLIMQRRGRWTPTWYSEGTVRAVIEDYAAYMGRNKLPRWAKAFEAELRVRINDEKDFTTYVYRYPQEAK